MGYYSTPMQRGDYYQGDYYQGDYYQGDPGFFSFLGGLAKKAVGLIPGVGPVASALIPSGGGKMVKMAPGKILQKVGPIVKGVISRPGVRAGALGAAAVAGGYALGRRGARQPGMRRRRRMNVCNPRALRRAIRRTHGFSKLAMRTIHLVHPKKRATFGGFKRRAKKRA